MKQDRRRFLALLLASSVASRAAIAEAPPALPSGASGQVSPDMFGAVANPAVDSTSAFLKMRDHVQRTGAEIRLPAGRYLLRDEIAFQGSLSLQGAGIGATQLGWDGPAAGLRTLIAGRDDHVRVGGVSLVRQNVRAASTALHVDGKALISAGMIQPRVPSRLTVSEVEIRGASQRGESWKVGIHADSVIGARLSTVDIYGSFAQNPFRLDETIGIIFGGEGAPVEMTCVGLRIYTVATAVDVRDAEGVYLLAPTLVQIGTGVNWRASRGMKPHLVVRGGHISSIAAGIDGQGLAQADIDGVLFYQRPEATEGVHIRLADGAFNKIGTNTFVGAKFDGIELAGRETRAMIAPQLFQLARVAVILGDGTSNCVVAPGSLFGNGTGRQIQAAGKGHRLP